MARNPVYVEPNQTVEIVLRTGGGRFLFTPSQVMNAIILGVLAKALSICAGIQLHAFAFMSNHAHLLMTVTDAQQLARFLSHFKGNLARRIHGLLGDHVRVWSGRTRPVAILDERSQIARLRYILAHGAKEGLVRSPLDWPGVHCARALVGAEQLSGEWTDGAAEYEDRRRVARRGPATYTTTIPIELAPLPCWAGLEPAEYQARCRELVAGIERDNAMVHPTPAGASAVTATAPTAAPVAPALKPRPVAHGRKALRAAYLERLERFVVAYREASEAFRRGTPATFPRGCFPPGGPFIPFVAHLPSSQAASVAVGQTIAAS